MDKLKILIIDDSKMDRKNYRSLLAGSRFLETEVQDAETAKQGIELLESNAVDCILLDYNLPDMDGIEVIKLIKNSNFKNTPIIMLTGLGSEKVAVAAMKEGAIDYLVKDEINSHILVTAITNAISQLKLEKQRIRYRDLQEQQRIAEAQYLLKSEFLTNMTHELRTPLNPIIGFTQLVHDELIGRVNKEQKSALDQVLANSHRLLQLIDNAIAISELEAGRILFEPKEFILSQVIDEVIDSISAPANEKKLRIMCELDKDIFTVYLDPTRFKHVLSNYLSNAIKFTPPSGMVTIRIKSETTTSFRLEVEDSGKGIEAQDMSKLFTTFQQLDSSASKQYQGAGLGLSLTKHLVEAQGGQVGVNSVPGKGCVFFAILPRKQTVAFVVPAVKVMSNAV